MFGLGFPVTIGGAFHGDAGTAEVNRAGLRMRLVVILDKQCNGAVPVTTDVFSAGGSPNTVDQMRNLDQTHRFKTLYDKTFVIRQDPSGAAEQAAVSIPFYKVLKLRLPIQYDATTGGIADLVTNNIVFYWTCDHTEATTGMNLIMNTRLKFWDY